VASLWLRSQGKKFLFALIPMYFMFVTTIAALLYTSYNLLGKVFSGQATGEQLIGNGLMGLVALSLVVMALVLLADGIKALRSHPGPQEAAAPAGGGQ